MLSAFLQENSPDFLIDDSIKWNFTKFLVDRKGNVVERFESAVKSMDMEDVIKKQL